MIFQYGIGRRHQSGQREEDGRILQSGGPIGRDIGVSMRTKDGE
jgi:hypothetical protein